MSLKKRILRLFGTNEVQLRWRVDRLKARLRRRSRDDENESRRVDYGHKHCPSCRSLVSRDERSCPKCGATLPSMGLVSATRVVQSVLPHEHPATKVLLAVLFGLFGVMTLDGVNLVGSGNLLAVIMTPPGEVMARWGAHLRGDFVPWRIIMSNFLHFGIIHLLFNAYALRLAGTEVERYFGSGLAAILFVVTGFGAMTISNVLGPIGWVAGASGALMGFIGLAAVAGHRAGTSYGAAVRSMMTRWAVFVMLFGLAASGSGMMAIDNIAHGGGLALGVALGFVLPLRPSSGWRSAWTQRGVAAGVVVAVATFGLGLYGMVNERQSHLAAARCGEAMRDRDWDKAVDACEEALELGRGEPGNYHNLALAQLRAQRGDDAVRTCQEATRRFSPLEIVSNAPLCMRLAQPEP